MEDAKFFAVHVQSMYVCCQKKPLLKDFDNDIVFAGAVTGGGHRQRGKETRHNVFPLLRW